MISKSHHRFDDFVKYLLYLNLRETFLIFNLTIIKDHVAQLDEILKQNELLTTVGVFLPLRPVDVDVVHCFELVEEL